MMKRRRAAGVALLVLAGAILSCVAGVATPSPGNDPDSQRGERASVVAVVDGDTIRVAIGDEVFPVRYIGIDAPEAGHSGGAAEWLAVEATEANRRLVEGQDVFLEKDVSETDRYGRLLRYVFLDDGIFVNAELVRLGFAMAITYPPDVGRQQVLGEMQRQARGAGRGLWGAKPTPADEGAE